MKKNDLKYIISWIMYIVGLILYVVFLAMANRISDEAWLYAFGASIGTLIFTIGGYLRQ